MDEWAKVTGIAIRQGLRPGDIGRVVAMHGALYAAEHGFDHSFEAYVAGTMAEFARGYDQGRDRLWVAEREGRPVGSIGIVGGRLDDATNDRTAGHGPSHGGEGSGSVGREPRAAQLRWLLVHPEARGSGLGRMLVGDALAFCRECGYGSVFLWTLANLGGAIRIYGEAGFVRTEEKTSQLWGGTVAEERYELRLS